MCEEWGGGEQQRVDEADHAERTLLFQLTHQISENEHLLWQLWRTESDIWNGHNISFMAETGEGSKFLML